MEDVASIPRDVHDKLLAALTPSALSAGEEVARMRKVVEAARAFVLRYGLERTTEVDAYRKCVLALSEMDRALSPPRGDVGAAKEVK